MLLRHPAQDHQLRTAHDLEFFAGIGAIDHQVGAVAHLQSRGPQPFARPPARSAQGELVIAELRQREDLVADPAVVDRPPASVPA